MKSIFLILLCIASATLSASDTQRRDGNWWRTQSELAKLYYIGGFFDGMDLGKNFSYWGMKEIKSGPDCSSQAIESFDTLNNQFFKNVTNDQIADGLNVFYEDYRNRRILVFDAVWLVVNGIAGTPQKELDRMIEGWRQNSN